MRIYGKNPIIERLKQNPKTIKMLYLQEGHPDGGYVRQKAQKWGIPVSIVPRTKIIKIGRSLNTQGILADIEDYRYVEYHELLEIAKDKKKTLVFLDSLNDPQNLGSIMRGVACLGDFCLILPERDSVQVTEAVLRVASGADNYVLVSKVTNLGQAIDLAKQEGFWIAGTVVTGGQSLWDVTLPFPLGLVIGSEQKGIRDGIQKRLDLSLTIPMAQQRLSLNVSQAATIFCYEIKKQRESKKN